MRHIFLLAAPLALAACTTGDGYRSAHVEEAEAEVAERLAGLTAVGTRSCLPSLGSQPTRVYADGTIMVRRGSTIFAQNLGPSCARASDSHRILVTEGTIGTMCSGSLARVVDSGTGMFAGSCAIGDWTEYKKADNDEAS